MTNDPLSIDVPCKTMTYTVHRAKTATYLTQYRDLLFKDMTIVKLYQIKAQI